MVDDVGVDRYTFGFKDREPPPYLKMSMTDTIGKDAILNTSVGNVTYGVYKYEETDAGIEAINSVLAMLGVVLGVLSILLNIAFLVAMQFLKNCSTAYYRLLQSLSFADVLASLTFIIVLWPQGPLSEIDNQTDYMFANALPYVLRSTPWMFFTGYLLTLSCLTINQYIAVCKPWKYTEYIMNRMVGFLLIGVWVVSSLQILVPLVVILVLSHYKDKNRAMDILFVISKVEIQIWMCVFIVSSLFNVVLDCLVYRKIRFLKLQRRVSTSSSQESRSIRMKQEAFVTVTLLLLASIFCRLPFPLMGIVYHNMMFVLSPSTKSLIHAILVLLLYINFFVDPIVYIFRMKDVRQIYKRIIAKYFHCCERPSSPQPGADVHSTQLRLLKSTQTEPQPASKPSTIAQPTLEVENTTCI